MEAPKNELQPSFQPAAAPRPSTGQAQRTAPPARVTVTLDLDADLVDWFRAQPIGLQPELNNLARFYMDALLDPRGRFRERRRPG